MTQVGRRRGRLEDELVRSGGAWSRFEVHPDLFADVTLRVVLRDAGYRV